MVMEGGAIEDGDGEAACHKQEDEGIGHVQHPAREEPLLGSVGHPCRKRSQPLEVLFLNPHHQLDPTLPSPAYSTEAAPLAPIALGRGSPCLGL